MILHRIIFLLFLILIVSCSPQDLAQIPPNPILYSSPSFAVVLPLYLRAHLEADLSTAITFILRQGDVVDLTAVSEVVKNGRRWYGVEVDQKGGWVSDSDIRLFSALHEAKFFSTELRNQMP